MRIILCDDEQELRRYYSDIIKKLSQKHHIDVEILFYKNGEQLLFDLETANYQIDLIFLDINMPGINGVDTARKLREYE